MWRAGYTVPAWYEPCVARRTEAELTALIRSPSFTPGQADLPGLLALLGGDEKDADRAERAAERAGQVAATAALALLATEPGPPLRARLVRLIGRLAASLEDEALRAVLVARLSDTDPAARRQAIVALGKLPGSEPALLEVVDKLAGPHLRAAAEALGKIGGPASVPRLRALRAAHAADTELVRIADIALLRLERTASRGETSRVRMDVPLPAPRDVALLCRAGLEEILASELGGGTVGVERVTLRHAGTLGDLLRARTALRLALPLAPESVGADPGAAVVKALAAPATVALLQALTDGAIRYRMVFAGEGHRRALVHSVAAEVSRRAPALVNDPTESTWEVVVATIAGKVHVDLVPRAYDDPRFTYRVADVPAASHPTIAAALARLGGAVPRDIVWDPFVGSGVELVERARLGPATLLGTDLDARALDAARANLRAAGVAAHLEQADAASFAARGATLIITNPPMGRRVRRDQGLAALLERFAAHAAKVLVSGGRLVWMAPLPELTDGVLRRAGLSLGVSRAVDMGGFTAQLQRWDKRG
jgi:predicted RNA methylase